jgi:hypothetical protein
MIPPFSKQHSLFWDSHLSIQYQITPQLTWFSAYMVVFPISQKTA